MQIMPGLHSLGDKSGGYVRAYLIDTGSELMLIDTLLDNDGKLVIEELKAMGRQPSELKRIIMTHAHQSHMGGVAALKKLTGARVYAHDYEGDILEGKKKVAVPPTTTLVPKKPLVLYPFQFAFVLGLKMPPPCEVDESLKDGDHIGPLTVLHTPGHTPGSMAFWWPEKRALVVGDMVTTWPEIALGWPQITLDNKQNRDSVGKLCDMVNAEILCVGHGNPVVSGADIMMKELMAGRKPHPDILKSQAATA